MEVSAEVVNNLRVLGLPPDATAGDVRAAFRRLARTYHPDVAGRHYSRRFEQIATAYAVLKELRPEEHQPVSPAKNAEQAASAGRRFSFSGVFGGPFAWYRSWHRTKSERIEADMAEKAEKEQTRRAAEHTRKKTLLEREARIDAIFKRGERLFADLAAREEREARNVGAQGLLSRLSSDLCQVRCLALAHLGELANQPEIFKALSAALQKWDIDEKTALLVSALPLTPENHRKLARGLADKAGAMPNSLLSHLLSLHNPAFADPALLETYLSHAGGRGIALIMKKWPRGPFVSEPALCRLMARDDESVLLTTLSAMKQRSIPCPAAGRERLHAHLSHPSVAVRVWAKALLNTA